MATKLSGKMLDKDANCPKSCQLPEKTKKTCKKEVKLFLVKSPLGWLNTRLLLVDTPTGSVAMVM